LSHIIIENAIFVKKTYGGKFLEEDLEEFEATTLPLLLFEAEGLVSATLRALASELKAAY
jgi:hypothetical protein